MSHYNQHPRNLAFIVLYAMQNLVLLVATTGWYDDMVIVTMGVGLKTVGNGNYSVISFLVVFL